MTSELTIVRIAVAAAVLVSMSSAAGLVVTDVSARASAAAQTSAAKRQTDRARFVGTYALVSTESKMSAENGRPRHSSSPSDTSRTATMGTWACTSCPRSGRGSRAHGRLDSGSPRSDTL